MQVGDNLHEMSNHIFMDNKKQYQIVIFSVCPESAKVKEKKLVTVFSEKADVPSPPTPTKNFQFFLLL